MNADGLRLKFSELRDLLINSDIDLLAVQESKLRKADKTPFIEGYVTARKDRNNILGGELSLFIKTNIVFEKLHSFGKAGIEILFIRLKTTKSTWRELCNVYLPSTSTQHNSFDPSLIKLGPFLTHWLCECPAGDAVRQQVFWNHKGLLEWLATQPGDVVAYARKSLVNLDT